MNNTLGLVPRHQPTLKHRKLLRKKNDALTRSFSPDYSGILLTTMAMQAVSGSGRSNVGTLPDTIGCTPAAKQIQAVGGIGYPKYLN
ncbi:hypothetical protein I6E84_03530 [Psychrobacter sp. SCQQ22]|uniref:hypothetical protein n=1 Tax=Psychrobacter sp. SCQQ22 TaxID=2792059 RepID=UPI0018CEBB4F|nr:hypothetical protein [Psychrobacter sp. SCQQ22]MBH0085288.1 hypothetical protein [Psychrobacter sp. SCQQ22]